MKKCVLALLALIMILLAACSSELKKEGKDPNGFRPSRGAAVRESAELQTEQISEHAEVDLGSIDGNTYTNAALGIAASFPEGWTFNSPPRIDEAPVVNAAVSDPAAIADAVEAGEDVTIFFASASDSLSRAWLSVSKNPLPGKDADALVNLFAPQVRQFYDESASMSLIACDPLDVDFCGEEHVALAIAYEKIGLTAVYEKNLYLADGDLLYTLRVSTDTEDTTEALLHLFEAIH